MQAVEDEMKILEELKSTTKIRHSVDNELINKLYKKLIDTNQSL